MPLQMSRRSGAIYDRKGIWWDGEVNGLSQSVRRKRHGGPLIVRPADTNLPRHPGELARKFGLPLT
jgi:hypothetical protein